MKKMKALALAVVFMFVFTLVLSGCGKSASQKSSDSAAATTVNQTTAEVKKEEPPKPVDISFIWWGDTKVSDFFASDFKQKNPNVTVNVQVLPYGDYVNKMKMGFAAGSAPDLCVIQPGAMMEQFKAYLEPMKSYFIKEFGENWKDKFQPPVTKELEASGEDFYGLPTHVVISGTVYVNVTKLKKYNLPVPKTYDELKNACKVLRQNNELPLMAGAKDAWLIQDLIVTICNEIAPGKIYDAIAGKIKWDDPDILKAFEVWQSFFSKEKDGIAEDGALGIPEYMNCVEIFDEGKAGFLFNGSWHLGMFLMDPKTGPEQEKNEWDVIEFPDINGDGKTVVQSAISDFYSVNKANVQDKKDAAFKFGLYMISDGMSAFTKTQFLLPTYKDAAVAYEWKGENGNKIAEKLKSFGKDSVGARELSNPKVKDELSKVLQEVILGLSPVEAAKKIQKVADEK